MDSKNELFYCLKLFAINVLILLALVKASSITNLYSLKDCDIPRRRLDRNLLEHELVVYKEHGKKLINFSMMVPEITLPFSINLRGYRVRKTVKAPELFLANITCRNILVTGLFTLIKLKYSNQDCKFLPGNFSFYKMPARDLVRHWQFSQSRIGKYLFEFEFFSAKGVIMCFDATVEIK